MLKHALNKSELRYADYTFFSGVVWTQAAIPTCLQGMKHEGAMKQGRGERGRRDQKPGAHGHRGP